MKRYLLILFLIVAANSFSQIAATDFSAIDRKVQFVKSSAPSSLSLQLTSFCKNDLEKVRSIFRWVADNIDYKTKQLINKKGISLSDNSDEALKSLDERVAESVLQKGFAVCDGYARLFKTLCNYAGIQCEIVTGYGRVNKSPRRFGNNHTWNAVLLDNKWQLLDVTWASGFISWTGDKFIRQFDEDYFLAAPSQFILEHYPDNLAWSLMDDPPLLSEFRFSPFKQKTFGKYRITGYKPSAGIIEIALGDTLHLELVTADADRDRTIGAEPFLDMNLFTTSSSALVVPIAINQNTIDYAYCAASAEIKWLYIQYNNDVIMRYRLVVKKDKIKPEIATR